MNVRLLHSFPRLVAVIAVTVFAPAALLSQSYAWKNVAIKGGGFVSGLVYHPTTPDVLYARTDVGGAFRWQAASGSWLPITDQLGKDDSQLTGIVSLALDPHDANRVYLACGQYLPSWGENAAILRSTDRGATWSRKGLPLKLGGNWDGRSTGERLQVDPNKGAILFLGTNQDGLWKSTDTGQTWNQVATFTPTSATLVLFDPRTGTSGNATQTIYVGVNSTTTASLFRSVDGGATWAAVPGIPAGVMPHHAKLGADGMLYVTFSDAPGPNGLSTGSVRRLKTADGTWTNITPPTGQGGFAGLALDALHPGTLVVTTLDRWYPGDEIYRSTDSGATWKALNLQTAPRDGSSAPYSTASSPHWTGVIEIDPFNAARAFFITGYGLFSTDNLTAADTNGQVAWAFRNDGLEETVPLALVSPPSGAPLLSAIGDIDGFRHDDINVSPVHGRHAITMGASTVTVGTNNDIEFAELAPAKLVRTHGGGTVRGSRSTDGGTTWTYFASSPAEAGQDAAGLIAISADGARIVWAPTHAVAYVSPDSGFTWTASTGGPAANVNTSYTPVADRVNAAKFYLYDPPNGRLYVSTNGGSSFAPAATGLPTGADPVRAVPGKEGHLWLPAWGSGFYRSTNSGASFTPVTNVQEGYRVGFGKAAPGQPYPAIFLWGKVAGVTGFFRSDDEGATWTRLNDDAHQFGWINALTGDPRVYGRVYLATGGRGIIYGEIANVAPALTTQPASQTTVLGGSVTFTAAASGLPAPTFQWQKNGVDLNGATSATLTLANLHRSDTGNYAVKVTNAAGTVSSTVATLVISVPVPVADFNHDSHADTLWHNTSTGLVASWVSGGGFTVFGTEGGGWSVIGTGDFDGDGKADALWRNSSTGLVAAWTSGGGFTVFGSEGGGWAVLGTGDFDGDGKADVLWHNTATGLVVSWTSAHGYTVLGSEGGGWQVIGTGDFNGDGKADLLWSNLYTGVVAAGLTNGSYIAFDTEGGGWEIVGVGDFNGDGKVDLLWHNLYSGVVSGELISGGYLSLGTEGGGWGVIGSGDFDGDGICDVLWRNPGNGLIASWTSGAGFTVFGVEGGGWSVITH